MRICEFDMSSTYKCPRCGKNYSRWQGVHWGCLLARGARFRIVLVVFLFLILAFAN